MKLKISLILVLGVLLLLFVSCHGAETEEMPSNTEGKTEDQTSGEGKVLLSALSDEEFFVFLKENVPMMSDAQGVDAEAMEMMREVVRYAEQGRSHFVSLKTDKTSIDLEKEIFDAAKAYYEVIE